MAPDLVCERRVILQPMRLIAEQQVAAARYWEGRGGRQGESGEEKGQGGKAEG